MIVEVSLRVTTDDGMPCVLAEERVMVIQTHADYEGNVLKAAAALEEAIDRQHAAAKKQVRLTREIDPSLGQQPEG